MHTAARPRHRQSLRVYLWHNKWLYLMMLPALAWVVVFGYVPMAGVIIAFKDYNFMQGIWNSPWAGLQNFEFMFRTNTIWTVIGNTLSLNALFIVTGTVAQLILAILFCEIRSKMLKRVTQSIVILPHFISWAVIAMFLTGFLNPNGIINQLLVAVGGEAVSFYSRADLWPGILMILKIWQGAGFGTIVYIAVITGLSQDCLLYTSRCV